MSDIACLTLFPHAPPTSVVAARDKEIVLKRIEASYLDLGVETMAIEDESGKGTVGDTFASPHSLPSLSEPQAPAFIPEFRHYPEFPSPFPKEKSKSKHKSAGSSSGKSKSDKPKEKKTHSKSQEDKQAPPKAEPFLPPPPPPPPPQATPVQFPSADVSAIAAQVIAALQPRMDALTSQFNVFGSNVNESISLP